LKSIDEVNNELLEECCHRCLELYNSLFGREFEYEDLFLLAGLEAVNPAQKENVEELHDISSELFKCSIMLEDESEEEKIVQKKMLEDIKHHLDEFCVKM